MKGADVLMRYGVDHAGALLRLTHTRIIFISSLNSTDAQIHLASSNTDKFARHVMTSNATAYRYTLRSNAEFAEMQWPQFLK